MWSRFVSCSRATRGACFDTGKGGEGVLFKSWLVRVGKRNRNRRCAALRRVGRLSTAVSRLPRRFPTDQPLLSKTLLFECSWQSSRRQLKLATLRRASLKRALAKSLRAKRHLKARSLLPFVSIPLEKLTYSKQNIWRSFVLPKLFSCSWPKAHQCSNYIISARCPFPTLWQALAGRESGRIANSSSLWKRRKITYSECLLCSRASNITVAHSWRYTLATT